MLALSRGGSIAGAARVLDVDSSTVSRRLAVLEQTVGACLVIRGGRDFALTAEGKTAVAAAEKIESIITAATVSIRVAKTEIDGVVRVTVVPSMVRQLTPLLPLTAERYPKLSIELNAAYRVLDLAKGEADIAIRMVRPTEIDLIAKRAFELGYCVYASKTFVTNYGLPRTYEDLSQHRLIQYVESMLHLPWFQWIETYANKGSHATRVDSTEMALGLVSSGAGIGVLSCPAGDASSDLVRVFPEPVASTIGWIVYHESARNSARVRAVVEMLTKFFNAQNDKLSGQRPN